MLMEPTSNMLVWIKKFITKKSPYFLQNAVRHIKWLLKTGYARVKENRGFFKSKIQICDFCQSKHNMS